MASLVVCIAAVACTSGPAPELTRETEGVLIARAIERACNDLCDLLTPYMQSDLYTVDTLQGDEIPMTVDIVEAIEVTIPGVVFVRRDEIDQLFAANSLVDSGAGVLLSTGPVEDLGE